MLCPVCPNTQLVMADRNGIEIDYCPSCRGVWLDRGELDKIIERGSRPENATQVQPQQPQPQYQQPNPYNQGYGHRGPIPQPGPPPAHNMYWDGYKWKRKKGWLEEIFD